MGFCNDLQLKNMAVIAAQDNVSVRGKCGSDIFPEYTPRDLKLWPALREVEESLLLQVFRGQSSQIMWWFAVA